MRHIILILEKIVYEELFSEKLVLIVLMDVFISAGIAVAFIYAIVHRRGLRSLPS